MQHITEPKKNEEPVGQTIYYRNGQIRRKREYYIRWMILFLVMNLVLAFQTFGQSITVNNITITNSAQITAKGDVLQNTGGVFHNNGTIDLTGNFTNNSGTNGFSTSAGTVILNGSAQSISGTSVTDFNNLVLSGTGSKILLQDATTGGAYMNPAGTLQLNDRVLELNSKQLTINNGDAGAISRTSGYIHSETDPSAGYGTIKWNITNNTGTYIYPFGNSSTNNYLPVTIDINIPGSGSNGFIALSTYPTTTSALPNNRPLPSGLSSLINNSGVENAHKVADRWWVFETDNYVTAPVSDLSFSYRESEWDASAGSTNTIIENLLRAQSSDGSFWSPMPMGANNPATNVVTVPGVNTYNPFWTLAGNDSPLPITLLIFEADLNKKKTVDLVWATATEVNNDFFTLEKSKDGLYFEPFEIVDGAGNSNNTIQYESEDINPFAGLTYYRLKSTDFDGTYKYSDIKVVKLEDKAISTFQVYPNPVADHFVIRQSGEDINYHFILRDAAGRQIREIDANAEGVTRVERNGEVAGVYFLCGDKGEMVKIIIQ